MPRFQFSLSTSDGRQDGIIQCDNFADALSAISADAAEGSTLEIGVEGFPPARYERVFSMRGGAFSWNPTMLLAA